MADARLRFSGWHIPFEYRDQYPCWENALDEEGLEDQDESTLRPCAKPIITDATAVAAALAVTADGRQLPAMIVLNFDRRAATNVIIHIDADFEGRVVEVSGRQDNWVEYATKPGWYPAWTSAIAEPGLLPLKLATLASAQRTGTPISFEIARVTPR